jgi:hypothetical protein
MNDFIKLNEGSFLLNKYGKYQPNISFVLNEEKELDWKTVSSSIFNLSNGNLSLITGDYWISKKGTNCFSPNEKGKTILLRDNWSGCFNDYMGNQIFKLSNRLYSHRASSNGGGNGCDYVIIPVGTKYEISVEDI